MRKHENINIHMKRFFSYKTDNDAKTCHYMRKRNLMKVHLLFKTCDVA